jgi:hypothetical protein
MYEVQYNKITLPLCLEEAADLEPLEPCPSPEANGKTYRTLGCFKLGKYFDDYQLTKLFVWPYPCIHCKKGSHFPEIIPGQREFGK